jgi:hypothetical protein
MGFTVEGVHAVSPEMTDYPSPRRSQGTPSMDPEPLDRWPTTAARKSLASRFDLPCDPFSQDWEWEVADPSRFEEFLDTYKTSILDEDERFALMEILIQCVEDMDLPALESSPEWHSIATLLRARADLHASSIRYWSCLDDRDLKDCSRVSGPMRVIRDVIRPAGAELLDPIDRGDGPEEAGKAGNI